MVVQSKTNQGLHKVVMFSGIGQAFSTLSIGYIIHKLKAKL